MTLFNINFKSLASISLPPRRRKAAHIGWLGALLSPLQYDRDTFFNTYWPDLIIRARYNSQTIVLTAALNRQFNCTGFYIRNNAMNVPLSYMYNQSEGYSGLGFWNESESLPEYLFNESESVPATDFTVFGPSSLSGVYDKVYAFVARYAQLGYTFNVII